MVTVLVKGGEAHVSGERSPDVVETVKHKTRTISGREYQLTIVRWKGLETYIERREAQNGAAREDTILADEATFTYYEPKLPPTICYSRHKEYTDEERAAGRRHIQEVAVQCLVDQGIW